MTYSISKTFFYFFEVFVNVAGFVVLMFVVANLSNLGYKKATKQKFEWLWFDIRVISLIVCFSFLGFAIGLMIGLSQSPVVQVAIPAMMTFYGGFITYLFAKDSFKSDSGKYGTIFSVIAVSVFLIFGIEIGAEEKNNALEIKRKFDLHYFEQEEAIKKKYR